VGWTFSYLWASARRVAVKLDAGGLLSREEPQTGIILTGPIFRFDDVF
jgi:hypothetical protein